MTDSNLRTLDSPPKYAARVHPEGLHYVTSRERYDKLGWVVAIAVRDAQDRVLIQEGEGEAPEVALARVDRVSTRCTSTR